jgi:hypothetical protein
VPDTIIPEQYQSNGFDITKHSAYQVSISLNFKKILKNYKFYTYGIGLNQYGLFGKRNFIDYGTADYYYYHSKLIGSFVNKIFLNPPGIRCEFAFGHIKKDLDVISLGLIGNLSFFKMYSTELTITPETPYESKLYWKYRGSYIGLQLIYSITIHKIKQ